MPLIPPAVEPAIRVTGLSKQYGGSWALHDVSFEIRPGEILGLIGPNGSGKTTLFRCVAGLSPADGGSVSIGGVRACAADRKRHLYFVPDGIRPWAEQTVSWALRYIAGLYRADRSLADLLMASLALEPLISARLGELSKGEHRRVMLAIGLLTPQPLLMLDEPFDGLDLRQTREVMRVLREHASAGRTLFLSIHQLADAGRICDRLVLLSGGRVVGEGTLAELCDRAGISDGGVEEVFLALV